MLPFSQMRLLSQTVLYYDQMYIWSFDQTVTKINGKYAKKITPLFFFSAIRNNILSGGDCCSRGLFIGACIAAKVGVEVINIK